MKDDLQKPDLEGNVYQILTLEKVAYIFIIIEQSIKTDKNKSEDFFFNIRLTE